MKKLFLLTLMITSVCCFANTKKLFRWKNISQNNAQLLLSDANRPIRQKIIVAFDLEVQKDKTLLTDNNKFQQKIKEICTKYNGKDVNYYAVLIISGRGDFSNELITTYYNKFCNENSQTGILVNNRFVEFVKIIGISYEDYFNTMMKFANIKNSNRYFKNLKKYQFEISKESLKNHLEKLNRIVYPEIGNGESWKELAVKIQLMIKSLE